VLLRWQRAGDSRSVNTQKVTTAVDPARGRVVSAELLRRRRARGSETSEKHKSQPDLCEQKVLEKRALEAVSAAASGRDSGTSSTKITDLPRALRGREAGVTVSAGAQRIPKSRSTHGSKRLLSRAKTLRVNRNCEGMWQATVLAVELLGAQQPVLGTDDGMSKATVAPDFHT
jgi:hypothetical protein